VQKAIGHLETSAMIDLVLKLITCEEFPEGEGIIKVNSQMGWMSVWFFDDWESDIWLRDDFLVAFGPRVDQIARRKAGSAVR
jgi:hypothetical protein